MIPKPDHPAIVASTNRKVRIVAVSPDHIMVRSAFGNWTYRYDELRTVSGKPFTKPGAKK